MVVLWPSESNGKKPRYERHIPRHMEHRIGVSIARSLMNTSIAISTR